MTCLLLIALLAVHPVSQDLSVAGLRKGLAGERSGLFMEQIRIVKEMRERDRKDGRPVEYLRPRYMVWENVPGAFSSNGGKDFQAVLTEIVRIAEPDAPDVPLPEKKWSKSGCLYDELGRWSIAWRVHDAQFWGVPQRRKRIALVADFGGLSAPEICFIRKGLQRDPQQGGETRKETSKSTGDGVAATITATYGTKWNGNAGAYSGGNFVIKNAISFQERAGKPWGGKGILIQDEHTGALSTLNNKSVFCLQGNGIDRADTAGCNGKGWCEDVGYTLNTIDRPAVYSVSHDIRSARLTEDEITDPLTATDYKDPPVVMKPVEPIMVEMTSTKNTVVEDGVSPTLTARMGTGGNQVNALCMDVGFFQTSEEKVGALLARQYKDPPITYQDKTGSLLASGYEKNGTQEAANDMYITGNMVRRLTPLECERLQGFPDGWTDIGEWTDSKGKKHKPSDSPRYKALGNSIALPFWFYLLRRISAQYERPATLGSLFDGIGGFPLCWERCNGKGTALWASEIEEFPIAVTKLRFQENQ